jgi:ligand-binding sensor domain-containing protein/AraC-like DNA-binding protein
MFAVSSIARETCDFSVAKYNISYLNMRMGLPNNFVNDIYPDSYGFIWVATNGGLVRYDGYSFITPGIGDNSSPLISNSCRNAVEDRFHRLWIAFDEGTSVMSLNTMRSETIECKGYDFKKILKERSVRVFCDSQGKMWLVTRSFVYHFSFDEKGNISELSKYKYVNNTPDIHLKEMDGDGSVWATIDNGLYRLSCKGGKLVRSEITPVFRNIRAAFITDVLKRNGTIWIGTNIGLYRYDANANSLKFYHHSNTTGGLSHDYVACLALLQDNRLLVGTLCGINIYNDVADCFDYWDSHSLVNPLSSDFIHDILSWKGLLFIGTETGGIVKLTPRQLLLQNFVHDQTAGSLSPNPVNAMYVEPDGTLWAGTVEGGLNRMDPCCKTFIHITKSNSALSHNSVSTLVADNRRNLWIGTWGGGINLVNMDQPTQVHRLEVDRQHAALLQFIGALAYDAINDGMWIGSNDGLFFYNFKTKRLEEPFPGCRDVRGCIGSIIDQAGNLWVGCISGVQIVNLHSRKNGSLNFRQRRLVYKLDHPESGIIDKITSFCQTKNGTLWLGSNCYGLYRRTIDGSGKEHFKVYTTSDGLANNSVKGIVEDKRGMLWITTDNGLSEFDPKNELFTNFTEEDGFVSSQFYWNSAIKGADGILYFGSEKGLTEVYGASNQYFYKGKLRFTSFTVDHQKMLAGSDYLDRDISTAESIHLNEGTKSFTIEFSALNYGSEKQGVYSYRMKGFEDEWIQLPAGQHSVRYTSLPSGQYRFEVKYASTVSVAGDIIGIDVTVSPYFWKSWWFITIEIILLAIVIIYLYKKRIRTLRRRTVDELYKPIEKAMAESNAPEMLQKQIQSIIDTRRRMDASTEIAVADATPEPDVPFMERMMALLEKNYQNSEFGVNEMCSELGVSRSVLGKRLNEEAGMAAAQFLRHYRLGIAYKLLTQEDSNKNVADVAFMVGFNDPKYFTRCFTKEYGFPPSKLVDN